jgi:hypothetical protein
MPSKKKQPKKQPEPADDLRDAPGQLAELRDRIDDMETEAGDLVATAEELVARLKDADQARLAREAGGRIMGGLEEMRHVLDAAEKGLRGA